MHCLEVRYPCPNLQPLAQLLFLLFPLAKCCVLRYQHHPRLVAALNKFAMTDCDLPDKWEKRLDQNSRVRVSSASVIHLYC